MKNTMRVLWLGVLCLGGALALAADRPGVQKISVPGPALAGNLLHESATRDVFVYLPPGYAAHPQRRYPVVYFLHGYSLTAERWVGILEWPERPDRAIRAGKAREMILVVPDTYTAYGGSMYSTSVDTGDWEHFIAHDLVHYIDGHYRTLATRASRGLAGHSMGGYGTMKIGMKNPDVYGALYAMSACCLMPRDPADGASAEAEKIKTPEEAAASPMQLRTLFASAAAWSPDPARPPFYFDLPRERGTVRPDVMARWSANAPLAMVPQYVPQLRSYGALALDVGLKDTLLQSNQELDAELTLLGVPHQFATYDGNHVDRITERVETLVLPFFSQHLAF